MTRYSFLRFFLVCLAVAAMAHEVRADQATFYVTLDTRSGVNELLCVTNNPFGYAVVASTNSQGDAITNEPGELIMSYAPDGILYGAAANELFAINPSTAASSSILALTGEAAATAAMAFAGDGTLYTSDGYTLYTANLGSGVCARVNPFYTNAHTSKLTTPIFSLAMSPGGALYGADTALYTINPENAKATMVGQFSIFPGFQAEALAFGSDGNLYMIGNDNAFYLVSTNDASTTLEGSFPGIASGLVTSVNPALPAVTAQPRSVTAAPGSKVVFSATATGAPTPAPFWYFNGAPIPSATNLTLTLTNVSASNDGSYYLVLTNRAGSVTSDVVTLSVTANLVSTNFTFLATSDAGGVHANSILSLSTNPVSETVLGGFGTSLISMSFDTNGDLYGTDGQVLYLVDTNTWGLITLGSIEYLNAALEVDSIAFSPDNVLYAAAQNGTQSGMYTIVPTNGSAVASLLTSYAQSIYISSIAFGPLQTFYGGEYELYQINPTNGLVVTKGVPVIGSNGVTSIQGDMKVGQDGYIYFNSGSSLYRMNPLTARNEPVASYSSLLKGLAFYPAPFDMTPPSIVSPPVNESVAKGSAVTLAVRTAGAGPQIFQWQRNGSRLQDTSRLFGADTGTLTINNIQTADAGSYTLIVSNTFGSASAPVATLSVGVGPSITAQPAGTTRATEGKTVSLSVAAKGAAPLTYQWYVGATRIDGANSRTLSFQSDPVNGASNLYYRVLVENSYGSVMSSPAEVTVLRDTAKPTVAIQIPALHGRTTSSIISGTTSSDATQVWYWVTNINAGAKSVTGPVNATQSTPKMWTATASLLPGTNILAVQSENAAGNLSTIASRQFFYEVPAALTLNSYGGTGTFTGKASIKGDVVPAAGADLNIGEGYSLTAKASPGYLFSYWSDDTNTITKPTIDFIMESGLELTANFVTNEFFGLSGTYSGLFPETNAATEQSAGIITGLKIGTNGAYSGTLVLKGVGHAFSGSFNAVSLQASNKITVSGGPLILKMTLLAGETNEIAGSVSTGEWDSDFHLIGKAAGAQTSAAYTMLLQPTNTAFGCGYATVTNKAGSITFSGKLPDGTAFSPSAPLSQTGSIPFYASLYGNKGLLTGWLNFDTGTSGAAVPNGQLIWIQKDGTTTILNVDGSTWVAPAAGTAALPFTSDAPGLLAMSGGGIAGTLDFSVVDSAKNVLSAVSSSDADATFSGAVAAKTGLVTFKVSIGKSVTTATGVYLQNTEVGGGYFTGNGTFALELARNTPDSGGDDGVSASMLINEAASGPPSPTRSPISPGSPPAPPGPPAPPMHSYKSDR